MEGDIARISDGTEVGKTAEVDKIVNLSDDGDAAITDKSDKTREKADVEKGFTDLTDGTELQASEVDTPEVDLREVNEDANANDDTNLAHQSEVNIDEVHLLIQMHLMRLNWIHLIPLQTQIWVHSLTIIQVKTSKDKRKLHFLKKETPLKHYRNSTTTLMIQFKRALSMTGRFQIRNQSN